MHSANPLSFELNVPPHQLPNLPVTARDSSKQPQSQSNDYPGVSPSYPGVSPSYPGVSPSNVFTAASDAPHRQPSSWQFSVLLGQVREKRGFSLSTKRVSASPAFQPSAMSNGSAGDGFPSVPFRPSSSGSSTRPRVHSPHCLLAAAPLEASSRLDCRPPHSQPRL